MLKTIDNIINHGKKFLSGVGLLYLLGVPSVISCESEKDDYNGWSYASSGESTNKSKYECNCEGDGLFAMMEVYAPSLSSAESWATDKCTEDHPGTGCYCDCVKTDNSSRGSSEPPCTDECSPHFALKCDYGPEGTEPGTWKCQEYWVDHVRCLEWVWKGTNYFDNACE